MYFAEDKRLSWISWEVILNVPLLQSWFLCWGKARVFGTCFAGTWSGEFIYFLYTWLIKTARSDFLSPEKNNNLTGVSDLAAISTFLPFAHIYFIYKLYNELHILYITNIILMMFLVVFLPISNLSPVNSFEPCAQNLTYRLSKVIGVTNFVTRTNLWGFFGERVLCDFSSLRDNCIML